MRWRSETLLNKKDSMKSQDKSDLIKKKFSQPFK